MQNRIITFIRKNMPFLVGIYHRLLDVIRVIYRIVPVGTRLRRGRYVSVNEKRKIIKGLHQRTQELPLFSGKRVLLWEPGPFPIHVALVSSIGAALALRGCIVEHVICDGTVTACIGREIVNDESFSDWSQRCPGCYRACREEANSFGIKTIDVRELVNAGTLSKLRKISQTVDIAGMRSFFYKGVDVGGYAMSSLARYYKGKIIEFEEDLLREYLFSALVYTEAVINKIDSFQPDVMYMSHGMYVFGGPALTAAMARHIPVVKAGGGLRNQCIYFRRIGDNTTSTHYGILSEHGWTRRLEQPLSPQEEKILEEYLYNRYKPDSEDFVETLATRFHDKQDILDKLHITDDKPIWCLFTHLNWDASVNYCRMAFFDYNEWVLETLKTIVNIPDVQWLIKIHPAERLYNTVDSVEKLIERDFPNLPSHIRVIPSDANINTYSLYDVITGGITCIGTTGMELTALGKPVILSGEAYYAKKGFTYDGITPEKYREYLRQAPGIPAALTPEQKENARKFAYSHFIQRQIPLRMFKTNNIGRFTSFDWSKVESLLPGRDPVVDMICERFFVGEDFLLDDEMIREIVKS